MTQNWPGRIVFRGFEVGVTVITCTRLPNEAPFNSPVLRAYHLYEGGSDVSGRYSWDQITAY